ncbi:hypothetical protein KEM54_002525 [Ascosphaera aggregata]|nr:hypothetical protein KEM54_002525 [Ascosphaera aggregata]
MFHFRSELNAAEIYDTDVFAVDHWLPWVVFVTKELVRHAITPQCSKMPGRGCTRARSFFVAEEIQHRKLCGPSDFEQHGITHAFVVQFANGRDRDYYCSKDPAHMAFLKNLQGRVDKVQAIDYEPGEF